MFPFVSLLQFFVRYWYRYFIFRIYALFLVKANIESIQILGYGYVPCLRIHIRIPANDANPADQD